MQKKVQTEKEETTPSSPHDRQQSATAEERNTNSTCHLTNTATTLVAVCFFCTHGFPSLVLFWQRSALQLFSGLLIAGRLSRDNTLQVLIVTFSCPCCVRRIYWHFLAFAFFFYYGQYSYSDSLSVPLTRVLWEYQLDILNNFNNIQLQWNISMKIFLQGNKELYSTTSESVLVLLVGTSVSSPRPFKCPRCLFATPTGSGCPGSSPSFRPLTSQLAQARSLEVVLSLQAPSQGGISTLWQVLNPSCSTPWKETNV